ncbi:MAG: hypothetical protein ACRESJ_14295, partial [Pseudomonas sp.]|uniref:hypothetical protein n=1 Tax=Pseudomonas sp. TaxID=306 RepID=UPI003D6F902C
MTITLNPASMIEGDMLLLAETYELQSDINFGPRGQGLRLVLGDTEDQHAAPEATRQMIARAYFWRGQWFGEPSKSLTEIADESGA